MGQKCRTCNHPEREQIEQALANTRARVAGGINGVVRKWGIPRSSLRRHLSEHMTEEKCARLLLGMPDEIDANIEEIIRREGEGAILMLRKLKTEHVAAVERWEKLGLYEEARKERIEVRKVGELLAKYAGMVPGKKNITNNNLVLADFTVFADGLHKVLAPWPDAQRATAAMFRQQALEHQP